MADARLTRLVDHLRPARLDDVDQAIIVRLEALPRVIEPRADFRSDLRQRLIELAPAALADQKSEADQSDGSQLAEPISLSSTPERTKSRLRRPWAVVGSAAAVLVLLLGVTVWLSSSSLPGDTLYKVKRAKERVEMSFTHGTDARGQKYLQFAGRRFGEASKLLSRTSAAGGSRPGADGLSSHMIDLIADTLSAGDSQARQGTSLVTQSAVENVDAAALTPLATWASGQSSVLHTMIGQLPTGKARTAAKTSLTLVQQIASRVAALRNSVGCTCSTTTRSDDLGPLPCATTSCKSPHSKNKTKQQHPDSPAPGAGPGSGQQSTRSTTPGTSRSQHSSQHSKVGHHSGQPSGGTHPRRAPGPSHPPKSGGGSSSGSPCLLILCAPPSSGTGPGICVPQLICVSLPGDIAETRRG